MLGIASCCWILLEMYVVASTVNVKSFFNHLEKTIYEFMVNRSTTFTSGKRDNFDTYCYI